MPSLPGENHAGGRRRPRRQAPCFPSKKGTRSGDVTIDVRDDEPEVDWRRQLRLHGSTDARRPPPAVPPMRRSFFVDMAAVDRRLYGQVQKIVWRQTAGSMGRCRKSCGRILASEKRRHPLEEAMKVAAASAESDEGCFHFTGDRAA
ncbi:hypothetical protein ZIOFF_059699 [Zingiber officinale]|uniref:Uncharacterized protein n=1 Tax=Zingiber officinale TaxID=94328 RepID=A0A8J5F9L8_ZINOF|nr:hypothetical protein ZIOFF_059699 [Zingiber officinale]